MLRQPPLGVWTTLRDELPQLAACMRGIDAVHRMERTRESSGFIRTVHEWRASAKLPAGLDRYVDGGALTWVETAHWNEAALESRWTVESRILAGGLTGSGTTRIEPAMGGRGTRMHFEISATLGPGALGPLGQGRLKSGFEDAAASLLAKTLQDLGAAVEVYLAKSPAPR
jgi:hypothetical protein